MITPENPETDNSDVPVSALEFSPCLEERLRQIRDGVLINGVDPKGLLENVNHRMYAEGDTAGSPEFPIAACGLYACSRRRTYEEQDEFVATADTDSLGEEYPCVEKAPTIILEMPNEDEMYISSEKPGGSLPFLGA